MSQLIINTHEIFGDLTIIRQGENLLFKANEILKSLGYKESNWRTTLLRKCKYVAKCNVPHPQNPKKEIEMNFISEGDVYRLIATSKLPEAEQFETWVFDSILPQIRKTGGYIPISNSMSDNEIMAKALLIAQNTLALKDEVKGIDDEEKLNVTIIHAGQNREEAKAQSFRFGSKKKVLIKLYLYKL